ncbi:MAG: ascorbate-dependent monooxygenase [Isosphaeraceae bacterium]|nr:ascorbate-dependent monooxygenase [Isosphaeraceae bacterium]
MERWLAALLLVGGLGAARSAEVGAPTYFRDVERILQKHCQECHRAGQIAPFPLLTYEHARKRASDLARVVETRSMPPWSASTKEGGPFRDARMLSDEEVATLAAWARARAPRGDVKDAPAPKRWDSVWPLGQPDVVLSMPEPFALGGDGDDEYRVFVIPTGLAEGRWVTAIDYRPGNPRVVHHVIAALDTKKLARILDKADPLPGYRVFGGFGVFPGGALGGWSPGKFPVPAPEGTAYYLPADSDILLQVHYHKTGKPETDASVLGLYFSRTAVDKELRGKTVTPPRPGPLEAPRLLIPAGKQNQEVAGALEIDENMHLVSVTPHMHWLGKDFLLRARRPDGRTQTLIKIGRWDFNWQGTYEFVTPVALPKGTQIELIAHFDNSESNIHNARKPPLDVRWGERAYDEMCIGFLNVTYDDEHRGNSVPGRVEKD